VKTSKNDRRDAEAIAEAVTRPTMRFVPVKDVAQQEIQALHRGRERLVTARTALVNELRGLLAEDGIVLPQGLAKFRKTLVSTLEAEQTTLTPLGRELFSKLFNELRRLAGKVSANPGPPL
jgi:transposase